MRIHSRCGVLSVAQRISRLGVFFGETLNCLNVYRKPSFYLRWMPSRQLIKILHQATASLRTIVNSDAFKRLLLISSSTSCCRSWISVLSNSKEDALNRVFGDASVGKDSEQNTGLRELTQTIISEVQRSPGNGTCCDCTATGECGRAEALGQISTVLPMTAARVGFCHRSRGACF